jgi:hypothetical protein
MQRRWDKDDPGNFQPLFYTGNWTFTSDRPGKYGWIGRFPSADIAGNEPQLEESKLEISFPVSFASSSPRVEIEYMRSYESFLDARVFLSCCNKEGMGWMPDDLTTFAPALRGWWSNPYTVPDSVTWQPEGTGAWEVDGHGSFKERVLDSRCTCGPESKDTMLAIRVLKRPQHAPIQKDVDWHFKLLSITTC